MNKLKLATVGFAAMAANCYAIDVTAVDGSVFKFREGTDTIVYIPSNATIRVSGAGTMDALLVGGGGGGGLAGGGGGGGAVVYTQALEVAAGDYPIVVGAGGTGGYRDFDARKWMPSLNGGETSAFDIAAPGGGAGGSYGANVNGNVGASGGGGVIGYFSADSKRTYAGSAGTSGYGFGGGASTNLAAQSKTCVGGGGGGAGGPGENGEYGLVTYHRDGLPTANRIYGGNGGPGVMCPIWGNRWYGGGGGGARADGTRYDEARVCRGGVGGGGAISIILASAQTKAAGDGVDGTGGGGSASGGAGYSDGHASCQPGGKGGRGVVILRYKTERQEVAKPRLVGTGGTVTTPKKRTVVHTFLEDGVLTLPTSATVDLLVVGGGGAGGEFHGGGGGGGGVTILSNLLLKAGSYAVKVGAGGTANSGAGQPSLFAGSVLALGGGNGGSISSTTGQGGDGATGGGASTGDVYSSGPERGKNTFRMGGRSIDGSGFDGGSATNTASHMQQNGGGGGGAGGPGKSSTEVNKDYGDGGIGILCDISGTPTYYGGGGGGGASGPANLTVGGKAGDDSAGAGGTYGSSDVKNIVPGYPGKDGRGGGGGGGGSNVQSSANGGKGGSGVVIVRYRLMPPTLCVVVY